MSSSSISYSHVDTLVSAPAKTESKPGIWARIMDARQKQVEARVRAYLAWLPEQRLKDLNFNSDEIRAIQAKRSIPAGYWI
jgi:hypothetical protein